MQSEHHDEKLQSTLISGRIFFPISCLNFLFSLKAETSCAIGELPVIDCSKV